MRHEGVRKLDFFTNFDFAYVTLLLWALQFPHRSKEVRDINIRDLGQLSHALFLLLVVQNGAIKQFSSIETLSTSPVSVVVFFFLIVSHCIGFHIVLGTIYKSGLFPQC